MSFVKTKNSFEYFHFSILTPISFLSLLLIKHFNFLTKIHLNLFKQTNFHFSNLLQLKKKTQIFPYILKYIHFLLRSNRRNRNTLKLPKITRLINHNFNSVSHHLLNKRFSNRSRIIHRWTRINFQQPRTKIFINHKIISHQFKRILFSIPNPPNALDTPFHNLFKTRKNLVISNISSVIFQ